MSGKWRRRSLILLLALVLAFYVRSTRDGEGGLPSFRAAPVGCELLVVRREILINSPAAGRLEFLVADGERVPAGQPLARIWPLLGEGGEVLTVSAPRPGVVSFAVDGLETVLTPETWSALRPEGLRSLAGKGNLRVEPGKLAAQGEPLFKLVDNLEPILLVGYWPADARWQPKPGGQVYVRAREAGAEWLPARVVAFGGGLVAISLERWGSEWLAVRRLPVEVWGKG